MKKTIAWILALLTLAMLLSGAALAEETEPETEAPTLPSFDFWVGSNSVSFRVNGLPEGAVVTSAVSNKPKRLKATLDESGYITLKPLKAGKATITVNYQVKKTTESIKAVYKVEEYPNPLKYIRVNGKGIDLKKYRYYYEYNRYKPTKTKIAFLASKGWKIVTSTVSISDPAGPIKTMPLTSNKSFTIPKGKDATVRLVLENRKGKQIRYVIDFFR